MSEKALGDVAASSKLPPYWPAFARKLGELYFSGTTSFFALGGNTFDVVQIDPPGQRGGVPLPARYGTLSEFLANQVFGQWDLVLHYDLARGLRCQAGSADRLRKMVATATQRIGELAKVPRDPASTLMVLDRFVQKNLMADEGDRLSVALIFDHASYLAPAGDRRSPQDSTNLVTFLNWASSPYIKRANLAFIVVDEKLSAISERLTANPHVATLEIPLPDERGRLEYLHHIAGDRDPATFSDYSLEAIAELTAGISLTDLSVLVHSSLETGERLDEVRFKELKKRLIERQAQGLLEFIEPRWGLDTVVGHDAAKQRLRDDAKLLKAGKLDSVPMGYLFCGPVGTGKSFLATCASGSLGIPAVKLKNFRSKYVGETEGNLERVLGVLRAMGPVVVIVDEADAMLGDRESSSGDSGVNSRIFGMIAAQMGDTAYRGRILWVLMTARPDLLPIDIKRQGWAEVHVPLFYPFEEDEVRDMFVVLARKMGAKLAKEDVPPNPHPGQLSGADIEGLVGRASRMAQLQGLDHITKEVLQEVVDGFMPMAQSLERELQEVAAIIECTDREFLPPEMLKKLDDAGGRQKLQERFTAMKRVVESM